MKITTTSIYLFLFLTSTMTLAVPWSFHLPCVPNPKCGPNKCFMICFAYCEPSCNQPLEDFPNCYHNVCKDGCVCEWGYLRNSEGICVPYDKC